MKIQILAPSLCAAVAVFTLLPLSAAAQDAVTIDTGLTCISATSGFTDALATSDLKVSAIGPAVVRHETITLPAVTGVIDLDTGVGQLVHSGGISLTNGGDTMQLQDCIIDTTGLPLTISAILVIDGQVVGRIPVFDVTFPDNTTVPLKLKDGNLILKGVQVTLDAQGANAINAVFSVTQFNPGMDVGSAIVVAHVARHEHKH